MKKKCFLWNKNIEAACTMWGFKGKIKLKMSFLKKKFFKIFIDLPPIPLIFYEGIQLFDTFT